MSKKNKSLPFIQTHTISFEGKVGSETWAVMAVSDGEFTRLYTSEDAESGKTPEWRITTGDLPAKAEIVSNGIKFQRNRKDFKGAILRRVEPAAAVYWTVEDGELVAHGAPVVEAPAEIAAVEAPVDGAAPAAEETSEASDIKTLLATNKPKKRTGNGANKGGPRGPRKGSVMSMSVEELQAEFTQRTGQAAPSSSIHYMRKLVLGARRGQERILHRKPRKVPTIVLTLDEARILLTGVDWQSGTPEVASKIQLFITSHEGVPAQDQAS